MTALERLELSLKQAEASVRNAKLCESSIEDIDLRQDIGRVVNDLEAGRDSAQCAYHWHRWSDSWPAPSKD